MHRLIEKISRVLYKFGLFKKLAKLFYKNQKLRVLLRILGIETNGCLVSVPRRFKPPLVNFGKKSKANLFEYDFSNLNPNEIVDKCKQETGFYPISFSFPENKIPQFNITNKKRLVSNILPGDKYAFESEADYYQQYLESDSAYAMKKGGWESYRLLEILGNHCLPIYLNSQKIPEFTMVHYPKDLFEKFESHFFSQKTSANQSTLHQLSAYFKRHLTTSAMAQYVLTTCALQPQNLLFIDQNLQSIPDYMSVSLLIGFKQILGKNCEVTHDPSYLYSDSNEDLSNIHGRGFGFSKSVDPEKRSESTFPIDLFNVRDSQTIDLLNKYDALVIGNFENNIEHFKFLAANKDQLPPVLVVHGGDLPLTFEQKTMLLDSGFPTFVREF